MPQRIPGGCQTNSKRLLPTIRRGWDCWVEATDGTRYLDCVAGLGPVILGHGYHAVTRELLRTAWDGFCLPGPSELEEEVAETLAQLIPCAEQTRFLKNGADATAAAVRLARAVTGRDHILRCGYHGYQDWCLDGPALGVPGAVTGLRHAFDYNDADQLEGFLRWFQPAAVILEPIVSQNPEAPAPGYLEAVRDLCSFYDALLIFDEVVTGFRLDLGGAQRYFGVTPDLAAFSKAMGNGVPIAALVGKAEYMHRLGEDVFVSTTFGGDVLGLAAAQATLAVLESQQVPTALAAFGTRARNAFNALRDLAGYTSAVELIGYPARLLERWAPTVSPAEVDAFRAAVRAAGVLAPGYYNWMLTHTTDATVLPLLEDAWSRGFQAAAAHRPPSAAVVAVSGRLTRT